MVAVDQVLDPALKAGGGIGRGSNRRSHANRSGGTGIDSFFDHLQLGLHGVERVFGSMRCASRIGQLDVRLLADLKQLRFNPDAVCGKDTNGRVDLYSDLRHSVLNLGMKAGICLPRRATSHG